MRVGTAAVSSLVAVGVASLLAGQQPAFKSNVDVIAVDATVLDAGRRPVPGLQPADFTITVDGKPRRVVSADFITFSTSAPSVSAAPARPALFSTNDVATPQSTPSRTILLVVDQAHIAVGNGGAAVAAAQGFVDSLPRQDRVGVVLLPTPRVALDLTTDRSGLSGDIRRIAGQARSVLIDSSVTLTDAYAFVDQERSQWNGFTDRTCKGMLVSGTDARDAITPETMADCERRLENDARVVVEEARRQTRATMGALAAIVSTLERVAGPKTVALLSEGLIVGRNAEDARAFDVQARALAAAASRARVTVYVLQLGRNSDNDDLSRANVTLSSDVDHLIKEAALQTIAGTTAGSVLLIRGDSKQSFARFSLETSGYYLIAVESQPGDRDGAAHRIDVSMARPGVTVRARSQFSLPSAARKSALSTPAAEVATLLARDVWSNQIPIRLATYTLKDPGTGKARVIASAEIDRGVSAPKPVTIGFVIRDDRDRVAGTDVEQAKLSPVADPAGTLGYVTAAIVTPGTYSLKLALVDAAGRTGNVDHPLDAKLTPAGAGLESSDLIVVDADAAARKEWRPQVDPASRDGRVLLFLELYGANAALLRQARVRFEVSDREDGVAAVSQDATIEAAGTSSRATCQASLAVHLLPPGQYFARAVVLVDGRPTATVTRPLRIEKAARAATAVKSKAVRAAPVGTAAVILAENAVEPFRLESVLQPAFVGAFLNRLLKESGPAAPALAAAIEDARAGRFDEAAKRAASVKGATLAVPFLHGLALLSRNERDLAADEFRATLKVSFEFFPAVVYLGACYAANGKDRDAAGAWQTSLLTESDVPQVYLLLADSLVRLNAGEEARDAMVEALGTWPESVELKRRLAFAYALLGKEREALAALDPYLDKHPEDRRALFLAIGLVYAAHVEGRTITDLAQDRARIDGYARRYAALNAPNQSVVAQWQRYLAEKK